MPREIESAALIDRFGVQSVYGRLLGVGEMRRMMHVEAIVTAYQSRERYRDQNGGVNFAEWAAQNKAAARLLNEALKATGSDDE
jgi:hypothetical protein